MASKYDPNCAVVWLNCLSAYKRVCTRDIGVYASRQDGQRAPVILIGNKCDFRKDPPMESRAVVTTEEAQDFAQQQRIPYYECSAVRLSCVFGHLVSRYTSRLIDDWNMTGGLHGSRGTISSRGTRFLQPIRRHGAKGGRYDTRIELVL